MTRVTLVGDRTEPTAISRVNRFWAEGLQAAGYHIDETGGQVSLHHDYRQHFATCAAGDAALRIAVRTWDFGPFPPTWTQRIGRDFDRLWVHTTWIRDKAIEGGAPAHLVSIVPHGFDPGVFTPAGPTAGLDEAFTFLFVGATVPRKGFDVLLRAYAEAFSAADAVRLVVKGHTADTFYAGQHMSDRITEFQRDPSHAPLRHIDGYVSDYDLAAMYRAADAGVFPYRAEGFAMPILEAMACGLPCIVPRFGACLDYCTEASAFFVEPRRIRLPVRQEFAFNAFEFREQITAVDFCEVPVAALAGVMRDVFEGGRQAAQARGAAAAEACHRGWTWQRAFDRIVAQLSVDGFPPNGAPAS